MIAMLDVFNKRHVVAIFITIIILINFTTNQLTGQVTFDFEDLPAGTHPTTQYSVKGVLFPSGGFIDEDPAARSGTQVLRAGNPTNEFHTGPFIIRFIRGQSLVRFFAGTTHGSTSGTLRAFDGDGNLIAQDGPKTVASEGFTTPYEVSVATPSIMRIEIEMGVAEFESLDDLQIEGEEPGTLPTEPPVVQITSPSDNEQLDVNSVTVQGTVTGEKLFLATLKVEPPRLPDSFAPIFSRNSLPLSGTGITQTFDHTRTITIGPSSFTVEAENIAGLKGSANVKIVIVPAPIHTRFLAEGGSSTFGELIFGFKRGNCMIAIYDRGAISVENGTTRIIVGEIFDKWLATRRPFVQYTLGCPTSEERSALGDSKAQDFENGRIYAGLPTGSHYIPSVFVEAIDKLGGEAATGVPIADPSSSIGIMKTWLFQQFRRPDFPHHLPSTLEIVGDPPVLRVERQGGDLSELQFRIGADVPILLTNQLPTIWQQFPCEGPLGPCNIDPPSSDPPIDNALDQFCNGKTYPWGPPEWSAILGDFVLTPILGVVQRLYFAGSDNPLAHECRGLAPKFPSDWNVLVRPLHPYKNLFSFNRIKVKLEFEFCWSRYFFAGVPDWGEPLPGDLLFASGRWVIDCGHPNGRSEIHPPSMMAYMRTETINNRPTTAARIWVNGIYTGDPVEFEIFPPPRPSPTAILSVIKPVDDDAAFDVNIEYNINFSGPILIRFTASPRHVEVEKSTGQMFWKSGRAYYGRWDVYWSD